MCMFSSSRYYFKKLLLLYFFTALLFQLSANHMISQKQFLLPWTIHSLRGLFKMNTAAQLDICLIKLSILKIKFNPSVLPNWFLFDNMCLIVCATVICTMFSFIICCHLVLICSYYPSSQPSPTCLLATIHVKCLLIFLPPLLLLTCAPLSLFWGWTNTMLHLTCNDKQIQMLVILIF